MTKVHIALQILRETLRTVFKSPVRTLGAIWPASVTLVLAMCLVLYVQELRYQQPVQFALVTGEEPGIDPTFMRFFLWNGGLEILGYLAFALGLTWLAICWHRFRLMPDPAHPEARTVLRYIVMALPISLLVGGSVVGTAVIFGSIGTGVESLAWIAAMFLAMRLSPVLPAAATGERHSYTAAWKDTRGYGLVCVLLVLAQFGLSEAITAIDVIIYDIIPIGLAMVTTALLILFEALFAVALITQLYRQVRPSRP